MSVIKKYWLYIISLLLIVGCGPLFFSSGLSFAKTNNEFINQALINALDTCYLDSYTNKTVTVASGQNALSRMYTDTGKSANIYLPFQTSQISCQSVLTKVKRDVFGNQDSTMDLEKYGYRVTNAHSESSGKMPKKCVSIEYQYFNNTWQKGETQRYCFDIDSDGSISSSSSSFSGGSSGPYKLHVSIVDNAFYATFDEARPSVINWPIFTVRQNASEAGAWQKFIDRMDEELQKYGSKHSDDFTSYAARNFNDPSYSPMIEELTYEKKSRVEAINTFLQFVSGDSATDINNYAFSNQDKVDVLQTYISQELQRSNGGGGLSVVTSSDSCWNDRSSVTAKYAYPVSGHGWCELRNVESVPGNDYIVFVDNLIGGNRTFAKMMDQFMSLSNNKNVTPIDVYNPNPDADSNTPAGEVIGGSADLALCYQGAGVLGWIACPVVKAVGEATGHMYEKVVEPFLQIKASAIMDREQGAYNAWKAFRDITNIAFVLAFAVVIIAQLTGIGISNYNIKKILPRLIVVAILVNVSFLICQLSIDISNLVGNGIEVVFKALPVPQDSGIGSNIGLMGGVFGSVLALFGLGAATTIIPSFSVTAATVMFWIWPVLLGLLGCLVSVLFFFIVLATRQAGVVILVILSPIAIVCYALPNTKSFFDRWKKMFSALLVVYPVCSMLMYGGQYAGALLLSIGGGDEDLGMFYTLTAMLVMVVPFFLIPGIVKGSMSMMGNIGMKISNFGNGVRSGFTRSIRGSRFYQEHQNEEQRRLNLRRDQTRVGRLSTTGNGGGRIGAFRRKYGMNDNLSDREMVRAAVAQSNIDKSTDMTAQAMRARWESDGTINDFDGLRAMYEDASVRLMSNPDDEQALQIQKAASTALASTKPGRNNLRQANDGLIGRIAGMSGEQRSTAERVMRRTANNLMRTNGGDIGKSPLLDEQMTLLQSPPEANADLGTPGGYESINAEMFHGSIGKLSARSMSEMHKSDLDAYLRAANNGTINTEDLRRLSRAAESAINDPRYNGSIGNEAMERMRQLANLKYTERAASDGVGAAAWEDRTRAVASADNDEISRIREGLRDGSFSETDQNQIKDTMARTLMRASSGDSSFKISEGRAAEINKILQENGVDLSNMSQADLDARGAADYSLTADQIRNGIVKATGMKVDHTPARKPTLRELHPGWTQATASHVRAAGTISGIKEGDWIEEDTRRKRYIRRLNHEEALEAAKLHGRDIDAKIAEGDERFNQQNNQRGGQQNNP